jgi:hypothetical protein
MPARDERVKRVYFSFLWAVPFPSLFIFIEQQNRRDASILPWEDSVTLV